MPLRSINPTTGEVVETFTETPAGEIDRMLDAAVAAFGEWRAVPFEARAERLRDIARLLRAKSAEYARTMAVEMGKPLAQGEAEVAKCAVACEWYAEHAARLLAPEPRTTDGSRSYVRFDPLGPVLAIMPWNFPFWQVLRFAAPTLMAGNAVVLKHASNVPCCALALEQLVRSAGLPLGLFAAVLVGSSAVERLIGDPRIRAVTLTGSDRAGREVAAAAGRELKKTVLELGGSDPFIVLEDADIDRTAAAAASARLINSGQSCIAAKRFIVIESVERRFLERFVAAMESRRVGDPLAAGTDVGPQARADLRDALHAQVEASRARGARVLTGGRRSDGPGAFYPPTVLAAVEPGMPAFEEETFGPVAAVIRARDEDDAVAIANASPFGLGASIWTRDAARAERLAPGIEAGSVFVNRVVQSDPRLPFGGIKRSGYGRELAEYGLREFVNVKTVSVG